MPPDVLFLLLKFNSDHNPTISSSLPHWPQVLRTKYKFLSQVYKPLHDLLTACLPTFSPSFTLPLPVYMPSSSQAFHVLTGLQALHMQWPPSAMPVLPSFTWIIIIFPSRFSSEFLPLGRLSDSSTAGLDWMLPLWTLIAPSVPD